MGMNTTVYGIVPPDDIWKLMKKVVDACDAVGIEWPDEVSDFFNDEPPDEKGVIVDIENTPGVIEYNSEMCNGFEVDITKLDPNIKIVRFVNSW